MKGITGQGFEFRESDHKYFLDGKPMTGVTTVLGIIAKPALINWAANQAVDYTEQKVEEYMNMMGRAPELERLKDILQSARTAHTRKRDKAAEQGTDIHAQIEEHIKEAIEDNQGFITRLDIEGPGQLVGFLGWAIKNGVKFTASEKQVYSKTHFTAGTLDFACIIDGVTYIGDIKTTSGIYDRTPFAQTAAYQMMWAELEGKKPEEIADRRIIVNLKKDKPFDAEKDVYVSTHYEDDIELFMSALTMYRNVGRFEPISYSRKR